MCLFINISIIDNIKTFAVDANQCKKGLLQKYYPNYPNYMINVQANGNYGDLFLNIIYFTKSPLEVPHYKIKKDAEIQFLKEKVSVLEKDLCSDKNKYEKKAICKYISEIKKTFLNIEQYILEKKTFLLEYNNIKDEYLLSQFIKNNLILPSDTDVYAFHYISSYYYSDNIIKNLNKIIGK